MYRRVMQGLGWVLIAAGVALIVFAYQVDAGVGMSTFNADYGSGQMRALDSMSQLHVMNDKTNAIIVGAALFIAGAVLARPRRAE